MTEELRRILIVDDNRSIHDDFRKILCASRGDSALDDLETSLFAEERAAPKQPRGTYLVDSAFQGQEGLEMVQRSVAQGQRYQLAFVDMRMPPGWDGVKTIEELWKVDSDIQVVICTAYADYSWEEIFERVGATGDQLLILKKPFDTAEVCQLACALTEKWHLARRAHLKLSQLQSMVCERTRELESSNQKLLEEVERRKASEERYDLAARGANDGLWDWDLTSGKFYYSPRWKSMLGLDDAEVGESRADWTSRIHPEDLAAWEGYVLGQLLQDGQEFIRHEYRIRHKDGQYRWVLSRGIIIRDASSRAVRAAGSLTDITDRRLAEEQLRFEAFHDTLTGLSNRRLLHNRLEHCISRKQRHPEFNFALLLIDLDRFKVVNDTLGHAAGDTLLVEVAQRLDACVRQLDTVSPLKRRNRVSRIGGDEFVILLEGLRSSADSMRVAERVHEMLKQPFVLEGREFISSASVGITTSETAYESVDAMFRDADAAMYQAKRAGNACTRIFDPKLHESALRRWSMESDLRRAIADEQLSIDFQPIVSAAGPLIGLEALVRWRHPERGFVPPDEFIPVAEECGLIEALGKQVMRSSCRQLSSWRKQLRIARHLSVSVNMSSRQFTSPTVVEDVMVALDEASLEPSSLCIEITESTAMQDVERAIDVAGRLRQRGVRVHVDDFGTGYSSLSQLHRIPIDVLKIDREFVAGMGSDRTVLSIVSAITTIAHSMNVDVVAEGVETAAQVEILRNLGCDHMQGYYFSKPLPADQMTAYLQGQATSNENTMPL